ncbi:MAG: hypothetical protein K940chlam7_01932 [Chlamydiae bacterium]|nr:hypothetical protein [Chlamydiota bacterium]
MVMKINDIYFHSAYYGGRWVYVPMRYVPEEAVGEDGRLRKFRFIPVDGQALPEPKPGRDENRAYMRIASSVKETILPERLSDSEIKKLCTKNDIPLGWVTNRFQRKDVKEKTTLEPCRRSKRKITSLGKKSYKKFIKQLKSISKQSGVIAEILWFLNCELEKEDDYITLEEVLRLRIHDVDPDDGISTCITLSRSTSSGCHLVGYYLPESIWRSLCKEIRLDCLYVFSNDNGIPILPGSVNKGFQLAGELAGLKEPVTSLSLRPISNSNQTPKSSISKYVVELKDTPYKEISIDEYENMKRCVPSLNSKKGKPPTHDPRDMINAILYH